MVSLYLAAFVVLTCLIAGFTCDDTLVRTTTGLVQGFIKTAPRPTRAFLGIPFAEPPVGNYRFKPAQTKVPWSDIADATRLKPACVQQGKPQIGMQEDCLTLNVYTPVNASSDQAALPVMFWIFGGGYTGGDPSNYEPSALVARGVIVVTTNYRLGPLGFFASDLIKQENPTFPTLGGVNGIADQIMALSWVKANAKAFGGDPDQILVFGESAGAGSTCMILASPLSSKLFKRAISESGGCLGPWGIRSTEYGLTNGKMFMQHFGAQSLDDLRNVTVEDILKYPNYSSILPTIDGFVLPQPPLEIYKSRKYQIPTDGSLIIGLNSLDTIFTPPSYTGPYPQTLAEYEAILVNSFGQNELQRLLQLYPASSAPEMEVAVSSMHAHLCIVCPSWRMADLISPTNPIFLYEYSFNPVVGTYHNLARHAAELGEVFGRPFPPFSFDATLSEHMIDYWTSFAKSGFPTGVVKWPAYTSAIRQHVDLNLEISVRNGFHSDQCDFWTSYSEQPLNDPKTAHFCNNFLRPTTK